MKRYLKGCEHCEEFKLRRQAAAIGAGYSRRPVILFNVRTKVRPRHRRLDQNRSMSSRLLGQKKYTTDSW